MSKRTTSTQNGKIWSQRHHLRYSNKVYQQSGIHGANKAATQDSHLHRMTSTSCYYYYLLFALTWLQYNKLCQKENITWHEKKGITRYAMTLTAKETVSPSQRMSNCRRLKTTPILNNRTKQKQKQQSKVGSKMQSSSNSWKLKQTHTALYFWKCVSDIIIQNHKRALLTTK